MGEVYFLDRSDEVVQNTQPKDTPMGEGGHWGRLLSELAEGRGGGREGDKGHVIRDNQ